MHYPIVFWGRTKLGKNWCWNLGVKRWGFGNCLSIVGFSGQRDPLWLSMSTFPQKGVVRDHSVCGWVGSLCRLELSFL